MVKDINGVEIKNGDRVIIHQIEEQRTAEVVEIFLDSPTINQPGYWVDVMEGEYVEGIMSYILEVIPSNQSSTIRTWTRIYD